LQRTIPFSPLVPRFGKPSLEDVFIRRTSHRFWTEENDGSGKVDGE
jgi:hypothetical protein